MKDSEIKINNATISISQTYRNAEEYYNAAILLINNSKYNYFIEEDLNEELQYDKYTKKNVIFTLFAFAYENYMKYLLLSNKYYQDPTVSKNELWGKWIIGHEMTKLFDKASNTSTDYYIEDFTKSLMKILIPYFSFNGNLDGKDYTTNIDQINLLSELDPLSDQKRINSFNYNKLLDILYKNNNLFVKARYSGENHTDFNFTEIYYFLSGIRFFTNINYHNNGKLPDNLEIAYIREKLFNRNIYDWVRKYRTEEEINTILLLPQCEKNPLLCASLLSSNYHSLSVIKEKLLEENGEHKLYDEIIHLHHQGNEIKIIGKNK